MKRPEDDGHNYADDEFFERITPLSEIPRQFRMQALLPGGGIQIIDRRLTYNWNPTVKAFVECGSVSGDAWYEDG